MAGRHKQLYSWVYSFYWSFYSIGHLSCFPLIVDVFVFIRCLFSTFILTYVKQMLC